MPRALLAGAFGQHNPGDEALLDAFLHALPSHWEGVATTSDPAATAVDHNCDVVASAAHSVAREVARVDAVVFAGGTVFKTLHPSSGRAPGDLLRKATLTAVGAKSLGCRLALVGVGVGSLDGAGARLLARALVRRADLLVVRDEESADGLAAAGAAMPVRVAADPAWVLLDEPPDSHPAHGDGVVVALSRVAGDAGLADWLAHGLRPVADAGIPIALQPWQVGDGPGDDVRVAEQVVARLAGGPVTVLAPPADLGHARSLFARSRAVVGLRFHSLVAAASAGRPFVAVAHEPKLAAAARRLGQAAVDPASPPAALTAALLLTLEAGGASPASVRAEIALAEESFRLLRLVLDGADSPDLDELTGLPLVPEPGRAR